MSSTASGVRAEDLTATVPFRNLPRRIAQHLAGLASLERHPPGHYLFRAGETGVHVFFLLEGEVRLDSPDNESRTVSAGTAQARFPLSASRPHKTDAVTTSAATLIRLPWELLQNVEKLESTPGGESAASIKLAENELEDSIYYDFYCAMQKGRFEVPSMPDVAVRISKAVKNPDNDMGDIARIIQMDPALTARIIRVVNSVAFGGQRQIDNCKDAVVRLGRNATRNLVISFVLKSLFRTKSKLLHQCMTDLWSHSSRVASICHILARITPGLDSDRAMLSGLIHDIGSVPLINAANNYPELMKNPPLLERVIARLRAEIGAMVLRRWEFMEEFAEVALHAEDWLRDTETAPDYTDLVIVSQLHAYVGSPRMQELPRLDLVPAFHKLALGTLTPRQSIKILEESKAEIQAVEQMLREG